MAKNQKFLKFGKITTFDEERVLFEKKRFHSIKSHLQQNWWAKTMPVEEKLVVARFRKEIVVTSEMVRPYSLTTESCSWEKIQRK